MNRVDIAICHILLWLNAITVILSNKQGCEISDLKWIYIPLLHRPCPIFISTISLFKSTGNKCVFAFLVILCCVSSIYMYTQHVRKVRLAVYTCVVQYIHNNVGHKYYY